MVSAPAIGKLEDQGGDMCISEENKEFDLVLVLDIHMDYVL